MARLSYHVPRRVASNESNERAGLGQKTERHRNREYGTVIFRSLDRNSAGRIPLGLVRPAKTDSQSPLWSRLILWAAAYTVRPSENLPAVSGGFPSGIGGDET